MWSSVQRKLIGRLQVAQEYKLDPQTLFTAIGYIDRFLSEMSVQRTKLQLVGVTAMLLAAKYEEIYPPAVDEFGRLDRVPRCTPRIRVPP